MRIRKEGITKMKEGRKPEIWKEGRKEGTGGRKVLEEGIFRLVGREKGIFISTEERKERKEGKNAARKERRKDGKKERRKESKKESKKTRRKESK